MLCACSLKGLNALKETGQCQAAACASVCRRPSMQSSRRLPRPLRGALSHTCATAYAAAVSAKVIVLGTPGLWEGETRKQALARRHLWQLLRSRRVGERQGTKRGTER